MAEGHTRGTVIIYQYYFFQARILWPTTTPPIDSFHTLLSTYCILLGRVSLSDSLIIKREYQKFLPRRRGERKPAHTQTEGIPGIGIGQKRLETTRLASPPIPVSAEYQAQPTHVDLLYTRPVGR